MHDTVFFICVFLMWIQRLVALYREIKPHYECIASRNGVNYQYS